MSPPGPRANPGEVRHGLRKMLAWSSTASPWRAGPQLPRAERCFPIAWASHQPGASVPGSCLTEMIIKLQKAASSGAGRKYQNILTTAWGWSGRTPDESQSSQPLSTVLLKRGPLSSAVAAGCVQLLPGERPEGSRRDRP